MKSNKSLRILIILALIFVMLYIVFAIYYIKSIDTKIDVAFAQIDDLKRKIDPLLIGINPQMDNLDNFPAPDIKALTVDGENFNLESLKNTKKIVVFASDDCIYCKEYYPKLNEFSKIYTAYDIIVVLPEVKQERIKELSQQHDYNFTWLSGDSETYVEYQIDHTPTTILINEDNYITKMVYFTKTREIEEIFFAI